MSMASCHCSSVSVRTAPRGPCPPLLTSTSIRPQAASAPWISRFRSSFDRFEPVTPTPPSSLANASPLPDDDRIATLKPSDASRRAASAPMPLPPAVITATLSEDITVSFLLAYWRRPALRRLRLSVFEQHLGRLATRARHGRIGPHEGGGDRTIDKQRDL